MLTGVIIGLQTIRNEQSTIDKWDYAKMFGLYLAMQVCRAIMVIVLYPIMKDLGQGLTGKEALVLVYGGLRGALGLSLALMVGVDDEFPERLRELVVFNMAGVATLTLLINGTTCGALVRFMGMIPEEPIKKKILGNLIKSMVVESESKIEELKMDRNLNLCDWD